MRPGHRRMIMPDKKDRIRGCLFGGAVGDALGYPVEFLTESQIRSRFGEAGITAYELDSASGKALISDDTQMTLFTADGLLFGSTRGYLRGVGAPPSYYISMAYSDWLWTQENTFGQRPDISVSWLLDVPELYSRRAPGNTCLSALRARKVQSSVDRFMVPPINNSKGCGGVMRVAPLCVLRNGQAAHEAAETAAITHGHPLGYIPAAILSQMIHYIVYEGFGIEKALEHGISVSERLFQDEPFFNDMVRILKKAAEKSGNGLSDSVNIRSLGEGWVAEEALAIAVYCSLRYKNSFSGGIIAAVNHNGDSDSTGAITGNILGALLGFDAIDTRWKKNLELSDVILEIADDLSNENPFSNDDRCEPEWEKKYVFCHRATRNSE